MDNKNDMFCFQCEQTSGGKACTSVGVCGKKADTADLQDKVTAKLIELATMATDRSYNWKTEKLIIDSLFLTVTNVNFSNADIEYYADRVDEEIERLSKEYRLIKPEPIDMKILWGADDDERSLKSLILFGIRGMAAYAHHAYILGKTNDDVNKFFYKALRAINQDLSADELITLSMELGTINLKCMEMLDTANTSTYGVPVPTDVSTEIEVGPFIIISGHDLHDLELLLEQTKDKGINIYTHGEMLPAHAYPGLKKYRHLRGNFGTAWQNQQKEFIDIPAPVLFTTNCIMPPKENYANRIFTTSLVGYPEMVHIDDKKDFSAVINKSLELGGYNEIKKLTGINGGNIMTTGFGHGAILSVADKVVDAVKSGAIKHFFLVGGCDGAKPGRNYYTDFVKQTPEDTVILTLACGKFRFNDMAIGEIGGLPRIMDMGQCNDAYGAIKVASALADAFQCGVNDLPLTMVLSWYEQKAVCILLTLLSLGIKNIYIGPSLPAFISTNVLQVLVDNFNLTPISTPEQDLEKILG